MSELLNKVRTLIRTRHYSYRTEQTYIHWIKQFIFFHGKRHPSEMGADEVTKFLSYLAVSRKVAAATQNQALAAILFLYRHAPGTSCGCALNVDFASKQIVVRDAKANRDRVTMRPVSPAEPLRKHLAYVQSI